MAIWTELAVGNWTAVVEWWRERMARKDIPDSGRLITADGQHLKSVRAESSVIESPVDYRWNKLPASGYIPQPGAVPGAGHNSSTVWAESNRRHITIMHQGRNDFAASGIR